MENVFPKYVNFKNITFVLLLIFFIIFLIKIKDIAILFFASFVISCSLEPVVKKIMQIFPRISRNTACAVVLLFSILLILLLFVPIIIIGSNEIKNLSDVFPQHIETIKKLILSKTDITKLDLSGILSSATNVSTNVLNKTVNIGKNLSSGFIYLIVSLLIIYYFMIDKDTVKTTILKMFPEQMRSQTSSIYDTIFSKIGGYVVAQIATMTSVGIIVTIGFLFLKIDYALLLGLITSLFDIIPVVGPVIAFIICMFAVYKYGYFVLFLAALIFGFAQLAENNFVRPYVFSKFLNLHPLIIFLFLLIAAKFMGILGVIFAPAMAATFVVLIEDVYMQSLENQVTNIENNHNNT